MTASASCATNTDLALRCGRRLVRLNSPPQGPLSGSQPRAQATEELNKTQGDPSSRRDTKKKDSFLPQGSSYQSTGLGRDLPRTLSGSKESR